MQLRPGIEASPGLAAVARTHRETVLPAQISILVADHLDREDRAIGSDVNRLEVATAIFGQEDLPARPDDEGSSWTGGPHIEKAISYGDRPVRKRGHRNLAMTRRGRNCGNRE